MEHMGSERALWAEQDSGDFSPAVEPPTHTPAQTPPGGLGTRPDLPKWKPQPLSPDPFAKALPLWICPICISISPEEEGVSSPEGCSPAAHLSLPSAQSSSSGALTPAHPRLPPQACVSEDAPVLLLPPASDPCG